MAAFYCKSNRGAFHYIGDSTGVRTLIEQLQLIPGCLSAVTDGEKLHVSLNSVAFSCGSNLSVFIEGH